MCAHLTSGPTHPDVGFFFFKKKYMDVHHTSPASSQAALQPRRGSMKIFDFEQVRRQAAVGCVLYEHLTVGSSEYWRNGNGKTEPQALTDEGANSRVIMAKSAGLNRTGSRSMTVTSQQSCTLTWSKSLIITLNRTFGA